MVNDEELVERLLEKILHEVVPDLRDSISATIEREVAKTLSRALLESEFHQRLNQEMREGLQDIYKEINKAAKTENGHAPRGDRQQADLLFQEAAQQLDKILQTTESATTEIMDIVEKHMDLQARAAGDLDALEQGQAAPEAIARLRDGRGLPADAAPRGFHCNRDSLAEAAPFIGLARVGLHGLDRAQGFGSVGVGIGQAVLAIA